MMKIFFVCLQLTWGYVLATPAGVYAYSDTDGNEYRGTFDDLPGPNGIGPFPSPFPITGFNDISGYDFPYYEEDPGFGGHYFANLQRLLKEAFAKNLEHQRLAYQAAQKAFDATRYQQAYNFPTFSNRFQPGFPQPTPFMPGNFNVHNRMGSNSAFASAVVGPGYRQQIASINPENPAIPNIYERIGEQTPDNPNGFYSVSSSSYASSSNLDGKLVNHRGSETMVNNNGKISKYNVHV